MWNMQDFKSGKNQIEKYGQGPRKDQITFRLFFKENKHGQENFCNTPWKKTSWRW